MNTVCERLSFLLASKEEIFEFFQNGNDTVASIQSLVVAGQNLAKRWSGFRFDEAQRVLASVVRKVVVHEAKVQVSVSRLSLRRLLQDGGQVSSGCPATEPLGATEDTVNLDIEARRQRCGGEVHLLIPPNNQLMCGESKPSLLKAIVRAHTWYQQVLQGKASDQRALARQAGMTERYVGRVFGCAFLAPDIVQSILDGRQPRHLTFDKLTRDIPLRWTEQREKFGF